MRPRKKDRHLPPCVYLRHGSYWLVRGGKWTKLGRDLSTALQAYGRSYAAPAGMMPKLIEMALEARKHRLKPSTWTHYQTAARKLAYILRDCTPDQITRREVLQISLEFVNTPTMGNRCISVLRIVFDYARDNGLVDYNPVEKIPRLPEKDRDRLLTMGEYEAIYQQSPPRLQIIMDLCYLTAQRVGDVLAIRYTDITDAGISFKQEKTGAKLLIAWTPELRAVVGRAKTLHGNIRAFTLLHTHRGTSPAYRTIFDQWQAAVAKSGVPDAHLHDIRAMAATAANADGLNAKALLGHTSEAMTRRYLRSKEVPIVSGPSFSSAKKRAS